MMRREALCPADHFHFHFQGAQRRSIESGVVVVYIESDRIRTEVYDHKHHEQLVVFVHDPKKIWSAVVVGGGNYKDGVRRRSYRGHTAAIALNATSSGRSR